MATLFASMTAADKDTAEQYTSRTTTKQTVVAEYNHATHAAPATQVLTEAFREDPMMRYFVPDDKEYESVCSRQFRLMLWAYSSSYSMCNVVEHEGVVAGAAVWEPATASMMFMIRMLAILWLCLVTMGVQRTWRYMVMMMQLEKLRHQHAPTAHHLGVIGSGAGFQGKGLGSKCIQHGLERADALGLQCYLESSNPKNVSFYDRHGFVRVGQYQYGGKEVPSLTLMLREARKER